MTYTPIPPSATQTDRADINAFLGAILAAFIAANPTVVRKQWSDVPASLTGEGPFVYLGNITEAITHDSGIRRTVFTGTLNYVDVLVDSQQTNARMNAFADFIRDWLTANARILPPGILEQTSATEGEMAQGAVRMAELVVEWTWTVQEGRN